MFEVVLDDEEEEEEEQLEQDSAYTRNVDTPPTPSHQSVSNLDADRDIDALIDPEVSLFEIDASITDDSTKGHVMRQTIVDTPIHWCPQPMVQTMALVGDYDWSVDIAICAWIRIACIQLSLLLQLILLSHYIITTTTYIYI